MTTLNTRLGCVSPINSAAHQTHADGLLAALEDRAATYPYHCDPNPYMRRTRDPLQPAVYPPGAGIGIKVVMDNSSSNSYEPLPSPLSDDPSGLATLTTTDSSNPCPQDYPFTMLEKVVGWSVVILFMMIAASSMVYDIHEFVKP